MRPQGVLPFLRPLLEKPAGPLQKAAARRRQSSSIGFSLAPSGGASPAPAGQLIFHARGNTLRKACGAFIRQRRAAAAQSAGKRCPLRPGRRGRAALWILGHNLENGAVGFLHPLLRQNTDVGNGTVSVFGQDAVAAVESLSVPVHLVAQNPGVHTGGDFGGAGGLRAVADGAGDYGGGVYDGLGDPFKIRPV